MKKQRFTIQHAPTNSTPPNGFWAFVNENNAMLLHGSNFWNEPSIAPENRFILPDDYAANSKWNTDIKEFINGNLVISYLTKHDQIVKQHDTSADISVRIALRQCLELEEKYATNPTHAQRGEILCARRNWMQIKFARALKEKWYGENTTDENNHQSIVDKAREFSKEYFDVLLPLNGSEHCVEIPVSENYSWIQYENEWNQMISRINALDELPIDVNTLWLVQNIALPGFHANHSRITDWVNAQ